MNVEIHLGKLMAICNDKMKENKSEVPNKLSKYLDAIMWAKGEPNSGTHFLKRHQMEAI